MILLVAAFLILRFWQIDGKIGNDDRFTTQPSHTSNGAYKLQAVPGFAPKISPTTIPANPANWSILLNVPFTSQAPFSDWEDERQQDGCEEAASLMAIRWVNGQSLTNSDALREILAISEYERLKYGNFHDTSAKDTADRIIRGYFKYDKVLVKQNIKTADIIGELTKGNLVLVPVNGQKLGNPFFTQPGPYQHMLVIRGWDSKNKEFIVNDPGTKRGEGYRYQEHIIQNALMDYETGHKMPVVEGRTAMIVIIK